MDDRKRFSTVVARVLILLAVLGFAAVCLLPVVFVVWLVEEVLR